VARRSRPPLHDSLDELIAKTRDLTGGRVRREQGRVLLELIASLPGASLDSLLRAVDLPHIVTSLQDRIRGPNQRTELIDLLVRQRLPELGVQVRAALLRALQLGPSGALAERAIRDILLATSARELTDLKNLVDGSGDDRDLQHLVFRSVEDPYVRAEILAHFDAQARDRLGHDLKILSDVDDTFYANWKDDRFPPKTVYPGVIQFYRELDAGPDPHSGRHGDLVFVTARPSGGGFFERRTHQSLRKRGIDRATVLSGSLRRVFGNADIASKKFENFLQYAELFPEYDFVFIGDSGQGDVRFGVEMLAAQPTRVRAVFIHDVVATSAAARDAHRASSIHFFDTYVGAATSAYSLRLLSSLALTRIIDAARRDFSRIPFRNTALQSLRAAELERDIAATDSIVGSTPA